MCGYSGCFGILICGCSAILCRGVGLGGGYSWFGSCEIRGLCLCMWILQGWCHCVGVAFCGGYCSFVWLRGLLAFGFRSKRLVCF